MTPWVPTPKTLSNGEDVSAEVLNPVLQQHTNRAQYLKEQIEAIANKSVLIAFDQAVVDGSIVAGNIVAFKPVGGVQKLSLAKLDYDTHGVETSFSPNNSSYVFGITKEVKQIGNSYSADVYLHGLVTLPNTQSLIVTGEILRTGPYFLSRKEPGKLTSDPSGIAVFVGFAKNSTEFYLNPQTDLLNQLFLNYRFLLLDRHISNVAPVGGVTLVDNNLTKVGWTSASSAGCTPPTGAVYFYNIPSDLAIDTDITLSPSEKIEAKLLRKAMPFYPASFNILNINCCIQLYKTEGDSSTRAGKYSINENGIWWYDNSSSSAVPWSGGVWQGQGNALYWADVTNIATSLRKFTTLFATKLNPELRTVTVTSLQPFKNSINDSANAIQFYNAGNNDSPAKTGDLLAKLNIESSITDLTSFGQVESNKAVKVVAYNQRTGKLDIKEGKVVTNISGSGIINVTQSATNTGEYIISTVTPATSGMVSDIEPDNATLEFIGLHSYLKLGRVGLVPMGLIGKIMLPNVIPAGDLTLTLLVMGVLGAIQGVTLNMQYSVSAVGSLGIQRAALPFSINVLANNPSRVTHTQLTIPAKIGSTDNLTGGAVVNFRLDRTDNNTGNLGIIGIYWQIA